MKRILFIALLFCCSAAFGQGLRWDLGAPGSAGAVTTSGTGLPQLLAVPGVTLNFCSYPANAVPCTNYATTYTSLTLGTPCGNSTQIVLQGTSTCVATSDAYGNLGVYTSAGTYSYTLTTSGGVSFGPFTVTLTNISLTSPGPIGSVTQSTGAFTTLTANSETVSGAFSASGSITGGSLSISGNGSVGGSFTVQQISKIRFCSTYVSLASCLTDVNASGGSAYLDPSGSYSTSSTLTVGSATTVVSLVLAPGAIITCNVSGVDCLEFGPGSGIYTLGGESDTGSSTQRGVVIAGASSSPCSLIAPTAGNAFSMHISDIYVEVFNNATFSNACHSGIQAAVYMGALASGTYLYHTNIDVLPSSITGTAYGLYILGNVNDYAQVVVNCYSTAGCEPVFANGVELHFLQVDFEHPGAGLPAMELNGAGGGGTATSGNSVIQAYFETGGGTLAASTLGLKIRDQHGAEFLNIICAGSDGATDCINISQSGAGLSYNLNFDGIYNNGYTNTVNDTVNSATYTKADIPQFKFAGVFGSTLTDPAYFDRLSVLGRMKIVDQGNCTLNNASPSQCSPVTFASTYSAAPQCFATWNGTGTLTGVLSAVSTTGGVTIKDSANTETGHINWICFGN